MADKELEQYYPPSISLRGAWPDPREVSSREGWAGREEWEISKNFKKIWDKSESSKYLAFFSTFEHINT